MANTSDYVPFATGTGATVLPPSAYAALAARLVGFTAGVADPTQVNTVWRQASVIAAMIGKFTADYGPGNVIDDGNVNNLEGQFLAALQAALVQSPAPGTPYEGADTGSTANAVFVASTNPASGTLAPGQVFLITKSSSGNTGAVTFKNGSNNPVAVKYPDGTDLLSGDWPQTGPAFLFIENVAGTLEAIFLTAPRLNYPGLPSVPGPAAGDLISRYSSGQTKHVQDTFADFAAAIRAQNNPSISSFVAYRSYATPGTYSFIPDPNCYAIEVVQCTGGGGGGAYSGGTVAGGGGGGFCRGAYAVTPGVAITIVVGARGTAGNSASYGGGTGGTSSVGNLCSASGGVGGGNNVPGTGGMGTGGQDNFAGLAGTAGSSPGGSNYFPGAGGGTFGGGGNVTTGPVYDGLLPGVGGTGGNNTGAPGAGGPNGGRGGPGLVTIKQLIS